MFRFEELEVNVFQTAVNIGKWLPHVKCSPIETIHLLKITRISKEIIPV